MDLTQCDLWAWTAFRVGFGLVFAIAAAAGGFALGCSVLDRLGRTVLGTHVRHFFTRLAPAKRFHPSDQQIVRWILADLAKEEGK